MAAVVNDGTKPDLKAGVGAAIDAKKVDVIKASAPDLDRSDSTESNTSVASASTLFSAASSASTATSVSTSSIKKSSYSSSSHFSSTQFRTSSKHLLLEDTCVNLELKGTYLHADCHRLDGSITHSQINLDELVGFIDGRLEWDLKGFSKHCFEYSLDGFFLVVKYRLREGEDYRVARLDLRLRLRNADGVIIIIELNKKLSVMLSEVPWMKFKVIAEPDLSVFAKHPVMQETLTRIAETTVEHVTVEMHKKLTLAMEAAIIAVTASAMSHVSSQVETLVQDTVGYASASASITAAETLHLYGGARWGAHGYAGGGGYGYAGQGFSSGYFNGPHHDERPVLYGSAEFAKEALVTHK